MLPWESNLNFNFCRDPDEQARRHFERAPGLDGRTLDKLLREAWVQGHDAGRLDGREDGFRDGLQQGTSQEAARWSARIEEVVNRRLNHVVRRLRNDRRKTTIAAERAAMEHEARDVEAAIKELVRRDQQ